MNERFRSTQFATLATVAALGAAGCGANEQSNRSPASLTNGAVGHTFELAKAYSTGQQAEPNAHDALITFEDKTRTLDSVITHQVGSTILKANLAIVSSCDSHDLIRSATMNGTVSENGVTTPTGTQSFSQRFPDQAACADQQITQQDYAQSLTEPTK